MTIKKKGPCSVKLIVVQLLVLFSLSAQAGSLDVGLGADNIYANLGGVPLSGVDLDTSYNVAYHKKKSVEAAAGLVTRGGSIFGFLINSGVGVKLDYLKFLDERKNANGLFLGLFGCVDAPLAVNVPLGIEFKASIYPSILAFIMPDVRFMYQLEAALKYSLSDQADIFLGYRLGQIFYEKKDNEVFRSAIVVGIKMTFF